MVAVFFGCGLSLIRNVKLFAAHLIVEAVVGLGG